MIITKATPSIDVSEVTDFKERMYDLEMQLMARQDILEKAIYLCVELSLKSDMTQTREEAEAYVERYLTPR